MRHHILTAVIFSLICSATSFAQSGAFSTDPDLFCETVPGDVIDIDFGLFVTEDGTLLGDIAEFADIIENNQVLPFGTVSQTNIENDGIFTVSVNGFDFISMPADSISTLTFNPDNGAVNGFCMRFANLIADVRIFDGETLVDSITTELGQNTPEAAETFICWENTAGVNVTHVEFAVNSDNDFSVNFDFALLEGKVVFEPPAPEPATCFEMLGDVRSDVVALLAAADPDSSDAYFLDSAAGCLAWMQDDIFWEQPSGNRLTRYGGSLFVGAAYTVLYLESVDDPAADAIIDGLLDVLECIVDNEIAYAIENDGHDCFIENAEYFAELGDIIDDDFDNEFVATLAYRLAWLNAFYATEY